MRTWSALLATLAIASTTFANYHPPHPDTTAAELQIRNKISLYTLAIDAKDYGLLEQVFTTDVVVNYNYTGLGLLTGVPAVQAFLAEQLQGLVTQHTISTTVVDFGPPGLQHTPNSTAYLVANYLGQRSLTGQTLFFYGIYTDQWVFEAGSWKSKNRILNFLVSLVDPSSRIGVIKSKLADPFDSPAFWLGWKSRNP
ncbi:hypothetical protein MMC29_001684 [Sticta canariensis]|nr:hypothetical protein [Sticta canariensis]